MQYDGAGTPPEQARCQLVDGVSSASCSVTFNINSEMKGACVGPGDSSSSSSAIRPGGTEQAGAPAIFLVDLPVMFLPPFSSLSAGSVDKPVYVYYEVDNFYQNHRRYVKSRSEKQLTGSVLNNINDPNLADCDPLRTRNGSILQPCGLVAQSYFNGACVRAAPSAPASMASFHAQCVCSNLPDAS